NRQQPTARVTGWRRSIDRDHSGLLCHGGCVPKRPPSCNLMQSVLDVWCEHGYRLHGEQIVLLEPEFDPTGEEIVLDLQKPLLFLGEERQNVVNLAIGLMAGQCTIQQAFEFLVLDGADESGHDLAFNTLVKTWNFQEAILVLLYLAPKLFVLQGGRHKEDLAGLAVKKIHPAALPAGEGIQ